MYLLLVLRDYRNNLLVKLETNIKIHLKNLKDKHTHYVI